MPPSCSSQEYPQLKDVVQGPILILEVDDQQLALLKTKEILKTYKNCCIVVPTTTTSHKLKNIRNLHRRMGALKRLQRQLCSENPPIQTSLIGIYPSLEYPACVYELNTHADRYVAGNVLPHPGSSLVSMMKYLIAKLLGANPAVGGLGLAVYEECHVTR